MSSSIIKSDNGVSSGVTGIISSGGSDGTLLLQTTSAGGVATTAVTIDNSQKVTFANSIGFGSNQGIIFNPSTQGSGHTSNTLTDYEEGTWTPSVGGTATYSAGNGGSYIKVGRMVAISFQLNINAIGTGSQATISGLPFASNNLSFVFSGSVGLFSSLATSATFLSCFVEVNSATLSFSSATTSSASMTARPNVIGSGTTIYATAVYQATF
jgi:hypothetical protein